MRTRNVPDSLISLTLKLLLLILLVVSVAGKARANLHAEARAAGCFATSVDAPLRTSPAE
jgi:hypothetical protein